MSDQLPNEQWSVDKLVNHANKRFTRMAQDCWHIGRCLLLCQVKVGRGGWLKWLTANLPNVNYSMTHRYMGLAKRIEHPDELQGMKICEALLAAGIITDAGRTKVKNGKVEPIVHSPIAPTNPPEMVPTVPPSSSTPVKPPIPPVPDSIRMPEPPSALAYHVRALLGTECRDHDLSKAEIAKAIKLLQTLLIVKRKKRAA